MEQRLSKSEQKAILTARLRELREEAGLTQQQVATELGVQRETYQKYEGRTLLPRDLVDQAADIFAVNPLYLMSVSAVKEKLPSKGQNVAHHLIDTVPVEAVGILRAGFFGVTHELPPDDRVMLAVPVNTLYADKPLKGFRVSGPSMDVDYPDGSFVVACPSIYLEEGWMPSPGQHVIVQRRFPGSDETEETIKEVTYEDGFLILSPRSRHPDYQTPWRIPIKRDGDAGDDELYRITGVIVWGMRRAPGT